VPVIQKVAVSGLLNIIEIIKPMGARAWEKARELYNNLNTVCCGLGFVCGTCTLIQEDPRDAIEALKRRFMTLVNAPPETGLCLVTHVCVILMDFLGKPEWEKMKKRAKELQRSIDRSAVRHCCLLASVIIFLNSTCRFLTPAKRIQRERVILCIMDAMMNKWKKKKSPRCARSRACLQRVVLTCM